MLDGLRDRRGPLTALVLTGGYTLLVVEALLLRWPSRRRLAARSRRRSMPRRDADAAASPASLWRSVMRFALHRARIWLGRGPARGARAFRSPTSSRSWPGAARSPPMCAHCAGAASRGTRPRIMRHPALIAPSRGARHDAARARGAAVSRCWSWPWSARLDRRAARCVWQQPNASGGGDDPAGSARWLLLAAGRHLAAESPIPAHGDEATMLAAVGARPARGWPVGSRASPSCRSRGRCRASAGRRRRLQRICAVTPGRPCRRQALPAMLATAAARPQRAAVLRWLRSARLAIEPLRQSTPLVGATAGCCCAADRRRSSAGPVGRRPMARSQAGAVLRYRLAPGNAASPAAYLRASAALDGLGEREAALGLLRAPARRVAGALARRGAGQRSASARPRRARRSSRSPNCRRSAAARRARRSLCPGRLCRRQVRHRLRRRPGCGSTAASRASDRSSCAPAPAPGAGRRRARRGSTSARAPRCVPLGEGRRRAARARLALPRRRRRRARRRARR